MNGLLSIIGVKTEMEYQMSDFPFGLPRIRFNVPKGNIPSDKQKCQPKVQHEFVVKGGVKLWQLLRSMLSKSIIIVKSKAYE